MLMLYVHHTCSFRTIKMVLNNILSAGQTAEHLVEIHPNAEIKNMLSSKK